MLGDHPTCQYHILCILPLYILDCKTTIGTCARRCSAAGTDCNTVYYTVCTHGSAAPVGHGRATYHTTTIYFLSGGYIA